MKNIITQIVHHRTLKVLKSLLPDVDVTLQQQAELSKINVDVKELAVSRCIMILIDRLYNDTESQYKEHIDNLVLSNLKHNSK